VSRHSRRTRNGSRPPGLEPGESRAPRFPCQDVDGFSRPAPPASPGTAPDSAPFEGMCFALRTSRTTRSTSRNDEWGHTAWWIEITPSASARTAQVVAIGAESSRRRAPDTADFRIRGTARELARGRRIGPRRARRPRPALLSGLGFGSGCAAAPRLGAHGTDAPRSRRCRASGGASATGDRTRAAVVGPARGGRAGTARGPPGRPAALASSPAQAFPTGHTVRRES
jgi:hypothetical protein